ncbi:hypothetical protein C8R44DRAFT_785528 [Mycena epipterygia]|nr:hypothetical protein C8R44DRAFT_785528 [Mycena epipterygia]
MDNLSACSRALQIIEIVHMICDEADTGSHYYPQKILFSLATTSRMFSGRALDNIWREQRSLVPLVKCMPDTLWEEKGQGVGRTIHLRRPIMSTDLPRLLFYSVRVETLHINGFSKHGIVQTEFLKALDMCLPPRVFMPRLSDFSWTTDKKVVPSFVHHFLGPQSRKIRLSLGDSIPTLSLLPYIKSSCPLLSEFDLTVAVNPIAIRLISDAVCGWQHLKDLSIANLDKTGFLHIASLSSLTKLNLHSVKGSASPYLPECLCGPTFPALKELEISCETLRFCSGIIRVISSRQFEGLSIYPLANWTAVAWKELHTTIHDCLDHNAFGLMEVSYWKGTPSRPADIAPYILSSDTLRPLFAFKKLGSISFQIYPGVDVDDESLEEMAAAWPEMHSLEFGSEVLITERPRATLKSLIAFARHQPELTSLGIRMNVSDVPEFSQVPGRRISHSLNSLNVGTSPIELSETTGVAAFLSNLFPDLEYLFSFDAPSAEPLITYEKNWNRVSDMLPVFCAVRLQEKEFWIEELADGEDSSVEEDETDG